jgi:hypothetical protein
VVGVDLSGEDVWFYYVDIPHSVAQIHEHDNAHVNCRILHEVDEVFSHFLHGPSCVLVLEPLAITLNHLANIYDLGTVVIHLFQATLRAQYLLQSGRVAILSDEVQSFLLEADHIGETKERIACAANESSSHLENASVMRHPTPK